MNTQPVNRMEIQQIHFHYLFHCAQPTNSPIWIERRFHWMCLRQSIEQMMHTVTVIRAIILEPTFGQPVHRMAINPIEVVWCRCLAPIRVLSVHVN